MLFLAFLLCLVVAGVSGERKEKEFTVFNVVRFPNDVCTSQSNLNGTCYTASECTAKGGEERGNCASGFGVCCVSKSLSVILQSSLPTICRMSEESH